MSATSLFLSSLALLSSFSTRYNLQAKNDVADNATYLGRCSKIVPIAGSTSRSADYYRLNAYLEATDVPVPVQILSRAINVDEPGDVEFELIVEENYSRNIDAEIAATFSETLGVEVGYEKIASMKSEIASTISGSLGASLGMSTTQAVSSSRHLYVDGIENPFGIYVNALTIGCNRFYLYYYHKVYSNYDQQELYQTTTLIEDADLHVYIPSSDSPNAYIEDVLYFPDIASYYDFLEEWDL